MSASMTPFSRSSKPDNFLIFLPNHQTAQRNTLYFLLGSFYRVFAINMANALRKHAYSNVLKILPSKKMKILR